MCHAGVGISTAAEAAVDLQVGTRGGPMWFAEAAASIPLRRGITVIQTCPLQLCAEEVLTSLE